MNSLMRAFALDCLGEFEGAIKAFDDAIMLEPDESGGHCGKGLALLRLEKYAEAVECFTRAIQLDSNDLYSYYGKGLALLRFERYDLANKYFNKVIKLDPDLTLVHYNKGLALMGIGGYRKAILSFGRAIELDPKMASAHYNRGIAWVRRKRPVEARACFDEVIRTGSWPMVLSAHCLKGLMLVYSHMHEYAREYCDHLISIYPKMAVMHYHKGCLLLRIRERVQYEAAIFSPCCLTDGESDMEQMPYREDDRTVKLLNEAIKCFDKAIKLDPDMSEANYGKGRALLAAGKNCQATVYFERAAELDPDMNDANYREDMTKHPDRDSNLDTCHDAASAIPLPWLCLGEMYGDQKLRLHCTMQPNVWLRCSMTEWPGEYLRIRHPRQYDEWVWPIPYAMRRT